MRHAARRLLGAGLILLAAGAAAQGRAAGTPTLPGAIPREDTLRHRWLAKPVLAHRLLDDMESLDHGSHRGFGAMSLTQERARKGRPSLRLTSPTVGDTPGGAVGRPFGAATVLRRFAGEDGTAFNRRSVWVHRSSRWLWLMCDLYNGPSTEHE